MKHHVVFIGDSAVGKTTLINRIRTGKFDPYVRTTIGCDFSSYVYNDGDTKHSTMFWDTCGRMKYISMIMPYIHKADLIVIVYDVAKPDYISGWLEYVPNESMVMIVPVIRDEKIESVKSCKHMVADPINIITGENIASFENDMKRLLSKKVKDALRSSSCVMI
tara:strand:- start:770 stop:1261 length:492 start_codon:yes stop_codon:yes gene_type:complete